MGRPARYDEDEDVSRLIGERIRMARRARGATLEALAEKLSLSIQQVHKYERGTNRVSVPVLLRIADILEFPISHFLSDGDDISEPAEIDLIDTILEMSPEEITALRTVFDAPSRVREAALQLASAAVAPIVDAASPRQSTRRAGGT